MKGPGAVAILAAVLLAGGVNAGSVSASGAVERVRRLAPVQAHVPVAAEHAKQEAALLQTEAQVQAKSEGTSATMGRLAALAQMVQKMHEKTLTYRLLQKMRRALHLQSPTSVHTVATEEQSAKDIFWHYFIIMCGVLAWILVCAIFAWYYNKYYEIPAKDPAVELDAESFKDFKFALIPHKAFMKKEGQKEEDLKLCDPFIFIWAFFLPGVRWAKTTAMMGFMHFWGAFWVFMGLDGLFSISGEFGVYLISLAVMVYFRQELRKKFEMTRVGGVTYVEDCLLYSFCMCCTLHQEAAHVYEAYKAGHPAVEAYRPVVEEAKAKEEP